jgi:hypothetical protein
MKSASLSDFVRIDRSALTDCFFVTDNALIKLHASQRFLALHFDVLCAAPDENFLIMRSGNLWRALHSDVKHMSYRTRARQKFVRVFGSEREQGFQRLKMTVRGFLIAEAVPCPNLRTKQLGFTDSDVEIATGGIGKCRHGAPKLLGRNRDGIQFYEVPFLQAQQPVALATGDLD